MGARVPSKSRATTARLGSASTAARPSLPSTVVGTGSGVGLSGIPMPPDPTQRPRSTPGALVLAQSPQAVDRYWVVGQRHRVIEQRVQRLVVAHGGQSELLSYGPLL